MAPNGSRVVAGIADSGNAAITPLWVIDLATGARTRLTFDSGQVRGFAWSGDSKRIAYDTYGPGAQQGIYVKPADGSRDAELLFRCSSVACIPNSWSTDGRFLLFTQATTRDQRGDLWVLPLDGDRKPYPLLATNANESSGVVSPDGRWFSYASDESGSEEVYVRPFPAQPADASGAGAKWLVSSNGGHFSMWRKDGKQLAYVSTDGVHVVDVTTQPVFSAGRRQPLLQAPPALGGAVSPDLERVLLAVPVGARSVPFINFVLNWPASIR
jgi:Tol biopolymer transport system component